eukprot:1312920-Pyramimonas_sp.AAC.1
MSLFKLDYSLHGGTMFSDDMWRAFWVKVASGCVPCIREFHSEGLYPPRHPRSRIQSSSRQEEGPVEFSAIETVEWDDPSFEAT